MPTFKVEGMDCGHCAASVRKAVEAIDAGAAVDVDLPTGTVTVDSPADSARIAAAITAAGYPNERIVD